jgi:hypothetical protein
MNFKTLLSQILHKVDLQEANPVLSGVSEKKERAKSNSTDNKSKDAARKRVERSREIPRDKKSKQELLKDIIIVEVKSTGKRQIIFKDSYNAGIHEKINKGEVSLGEAQQVTQSDNFEQTRASKLLGFNKQDKDSETTNKGKSEQKSRDDSKPSSSQDKEGKEKPKAKRMSKDDMFQSMAQMTPEQLVGMPPDLRNEYFKMVRKPTPNSDFDKMSYERLSVEYGLSDVSGAPYNEQVMNALVFLAKLKTGASDQEVQTYFSLAPDAREFTRSAFFTARKILSQVGEQCLQNLITNVETTGKPVSSDGAPDMSCGEYRFKIAAAGEISFSSTEFDQSNKNFKNYVSNSFTQALSNPELIGSDPQLKAAFEKMQQGKEQFSKILVPDELVAQIQADPALLKKLQQAKILGPDGSVVGTIFDENGNLNPLASVSNYSKAWSDAAKDLIKGKAKKSSLKNNVITSLLKTILRGDNITDPDQAPNHVVTINGILPMSDDYFNQIAQNSDIDIKPSKDIITPSNVLNYKPSAAELLKSYTTVVEAAQPKKKESLESLLVQRDSIEPIGIMVNSIVKNNDFLLNGSLLPGFNTKDLNGVQYNYVTIGKKTIKIPVMKGENISNEVLGESVVFVNDILIESLTNNFVLTNLVRNELVSETEAGFILNSSELLTENSEYVMLNVSSIYENVMQRIIDEPLRLSGFIGDMMVEVYKRDYKKEYKNYHGKKKQRKERSARGTARDLMIKKGRAKKGDGKDIDHKRPLRSGGSKGINNLRVRDKSANRADNGHHKGEHQNRD